MGSLQNVHIGQQILLQMRRKGMSYAQLARQLNLDRSTVYWMVKQKSIDSERLFKLCKILEYDFFASAYQPLLYNSTFKLNTDAIRNISLDELKEVINSLPVNSSITVKINKNSSNIDI